MAKVWWHREAPARPHPSGDLPEEVTSVRRIMSDRLPEHIGREVTLKGWVHRRRVLRDVAFLILRDAHGLAQIVVRDGATLLPFPEETPVAVVGEVIARPAAPHGVEVVRPTLTALSDPAVPPPFDLYRPTLTASLPTLLDHAPVALRHPSRAHVQRVTAAAVGAFRRVLE